MNKLKAVYLNNEWCEIIDCISCPHYDLEHDEDFPEKACMLIYYLHNIGKHLGLITCPLPLWDIVRWHTADEVPEERKDLYIKINTDGTDVFEPGYYWECAFRHHYTGDRMEGRYSKIISWRYLNEQK